jgi:hypothetical protein
MCSYSKKCLKAILKPVYKSSGFVVVFFSYKWFFYKIFLKKEKKDATSRFFYIYIFNIFFKYFLGALQTSLGLCCRDVETTFCIMETTFCMDETTFCIVGNNFLYVKTT